MCFGKAECPVDARPTRGRIFGILLAGTPGPGLLHSSDPARLLRISIWEKLKQPVAVRAHGFGHEPDGPAYVRCDLVVLPVVAHSSYDNPMLVGKRDALFRSEPFGDLLGPIGWINQIAVKVNIGHLRQIRAHS